MLEQAAAEERPKGDLKTWLFNPFYYVAGGPALAAGLALMLLAGLLTALSHSHFDGVLDFHTGVASALWLHLVEGPIDWLALSIPLWAGGLLISKSKTRALDLFGTQALARFPYAILAAAALLPGYRHYSAFLVARFIGGGSVPEPAKSDIAIFGLVILVMLLTAIWMVLLMYRSFAISYNVSGGPVVGVFIAAMIIGEILSKLALSLLFAS